MTEYSTEVIAGVHLIETRSLENPNLPLTDPAAWRDVFGWGASATGESITARKAMSYAPFWHGVQMISGDIARLKRKVYRRRWDLGDDAREPYRGHPLNRLLNRAPNDEIDSVTFWMRFMADALVWRNAYAVIGRNGITTPMELFNLLPDRTRRERINGQLFYITEIDSDRNPRLRAFLPEDVIHVQGPDVRGLEDHDTIFQLFRDVIGLGLAQQRFASKFFRNGGRIGGILELPSGMPKQARDNLEQGFRTTYEGADNPFKTVILRDNAKFHAGQITPRESQMSEATEAHTRMICHILNLAPSKLGLSDSVSYNSKAEDNQNYIDQTLGIWMTKIESQCNQKLLSDREEDDVFIEHSTSALLRLNPLAQAQMHQIQIASRVRNPNECRADINLLPYEGGEEYINPNTTIGGGPQTKVETVEDDEDDEPAERQVRRPLTDLTLAELRRALRATVTATGPDSSSAAALREAITAKQRPRAIEYRKPDAAVLRVLFGITARARDKAKRPKAFLEWLDGNWEPHRQEWRHLWDDKPWPFDVLIDDLKDHVQHWNESELAQRVDEWCAIVEDRQWC